MSAAEKLKALDEALHPDVSTIAYPEKIVALRRVLPQLVALTEAVEATDYGLIPVQRQNMHGGQMAPATIIMIDPEQWEAILSALAAVDEALP